LPFTFAARIMAEAAAGEVVVSRTVKDLVAGSDIEFDDAGEHFLKGIEEKWQLLAWEFGAMQRGGGLVCRNAFGTAHFSG
jgi:class 3 adenylate cyclase